MRLKNKVVVITGAAGLLGKEHAMAILSEGGSVALLDVNLDALGQFEQSLTGDERKRIGSYQCDITDEAQVIEVSNLIKSKFGNVTGLVNNAAINAAVEGDMRGFNRLEDFSISDWSMELAVGLTGAMICVKIFGAAMVESGTPGSIVHIASDYGIIAPNQNLYREEGIPERNQRVKPVSYSVVKHGLIGLSKYVATYWSNQGIRSNALCPGGVRNGQSEEFIDALSKLIPLGRPAESSEYRGALVFLLSDESGYMTGSTLVIDGGRSIW